MPHLEKTNDPKLIPSSSVSIKISESTDDDIILVKGVDHANAAYDVVLFAYAFATLATLIKTVAWWFNQWPFISHFNFFLKWLMSASIAGFEYLPLTYAFQYANRNGVALSIMTAYMEASDNCFRMIQQLALGLPLAWFDWVGAAMLVVAVIYQGALHYRMSFSAEHDHKVEDRLILEPKYSKYVIAGAILSTLVFSLTLSLAAGPVGQAYTLATLATGVLPF